MAKRTIQQKLFGLRTFLTKPAVRALSTLLGPRAQGAYLLALAALGYSMTGEALLVIDPINVAAFCAAQGDSHEQVLP